MAFFYNDEGGLIHVVDNFNTALKYSKGLIEEADYQNGGGYPTLEVDGKQDNVFIYTEDYQDFDSDTNEVIPGGIKKGCYVGGNGRINSGAKKVDLETLPAKLQEIAKKLGYQEDSNGIV